MSSWLQPASTKSAALLLAACIIGAAASAAIATDHLDIAVMLAGLVFSGSVVYSNRLSLAGWCTLLLLASVVARAPVTLLGLPSILEFSHYPIAVAFAWAATRRPKPAPAARTGSGRWLAALVFITLASALANASHPLRAIFFLVIVGEPLLILWCIERWGVDESSERRLMLVLASVMAIQVPVGLWQGLTLGFTDPVQGTLMGHGAGAHVLGGLFGLAAIVTAAGAQARRIRPLYAMGVGAACLGMIGAAGAMAVLLLTGFSLAIVSLIGPPRGSSRRAPRMRSGAVIVAVLGALGAVYFAQLILPNLFQRIERIVAVGVFPEIDILQERLGEDPVAPVFGSGPGTSGSRTSLLLTGAEYEPGSPLLALALPPTEIGLELRKKDDLNRAKYGGSADTAASTALGIIGDLGLSGFIPMIALFVAIWRKAGRVGSWLAPAIKASIIWVSMLIFLDNWLEYPEFAIPLAMVVGFGISRARSGSQRDPQVSSSTRLLSQRSVM